jgi:hypothetical protein
MGYQLPQSIYTELSVSPLSHTLACSGANPSQMPDPDKVLCTNFRRHRRTYGMSG